MCVFTVYVATEVNSPGTHISSAVCCVVIHAIEQSAIHLCYICHAQNGVRGTVGTNICLHTNSDGG